MDQYDASSLLSSILVRPGEKLTKAEFPRGFLASFHMMSALSYLSFLSGWAQNKNEGEYPRGFLVSSHMMPALSYLHFLSGQAKNNKRKNVREA